MPNIIRGLRHVALSETWHKFGTSLFPKIWATRGKGFFVGFLWLFFGQNFIKIARGPSLKIFKFGVLVLRYAVMYETHVFFVIIIFCEFGLAITACRETSVSYITACRWMRGNTVIENLKTAAAIMIMKALTQKKSTHLFFTREQPVYELRLIPAIYFSNSLHCRKTSQFSSS